MNQPLSVLVMKIALKQILLQMQILLCKILLQKYK